MSPSIDIAGRRIGAGAPSYVISEIGVNHDGDAGRAVEMIEASAECGADGAKLQIVDADAAYLPGTESHAVFSDKALSDAELSRLMATAERAGVHLFATPGDPRSLERMLALGMPAIKISSGLMTNTPMLRAVARARLPLIVSTGMASLEEAAAAVAAIEAVSPEAEIALLHCVSLYPSPAETVNLRAMEALRALDRPVGYSDHFIGPAACLAAVARGAELIEKHFSLDPSLQGADHHLSAGPEEMKAMIRSIRDIEAMMGDGVKAPHPEEAARRSGRHRYLVAAGPIAAGATLTEAILAAKRTPAGVGEISAAEIDSVLGRRLRRDLAPNEPISQTDLEPV